MKTPLVVPFCLLAGLSFAGDGAPAPGAPTRQASLAVALGSDVAGVGLSAEKYLAGGRLSVFAGAGYIFGSSDGRGATGAGAAGGLRVYSGGQKHRVFGEASFSPVAVEVAPEGSGLRGETISYGPGVSVGYNLVTSGGFTLALSVGVGQAVTGSSDAHGTEPLSSIALGYTWVRR